MKNLEIRIPGTPENADTTTVPVNKSSEQYSIDWKDALIGFLMAVGTATGPYIYDAIMMWFDHKEPDFDIRTCLKFAFSAAIMYIGRKFFQKGQIVIKKSELTPQ